MWLHGVVVSPTYILTCTCLFKLVSRRLIRFSKFAEPRLYFRSKKESIFMSYWENLPSNYRYHYFRLLLQTWYLIPSRDQDKTKQCCKLHCYVRSQAYCYVPPQTLMKVSCESWRGIRAEIQTFRLSPKLAQESLGDREIWGVRGRKEEGLNVGSALSECIAS